MKKVFFFLGTVVLLFAAASCKTAINPEQPAAVSVTERINNGGAVVDFKDEVLSEDAAVNKSVTVENADFSGKTLTVNVPGVTLKNLKNIHVVVAAGVGAGNLSIENCTISDLEIADSSSSIHIAGTSAITSVSVIGSAVHIVLENTATVTILKIETTGVSVQGDTNTKISTMQVGAVVDTVSVAGGTIGTIVVSETTGGKSPTITVTGKTSIESAKAVDESGKETGCTFIITADAKNEGFSTSNIPDAKEVTVTGAELVKDTTVKTNYETGDVFDYTGLSVKLTYSNNSVATVALNRRNCSISGFDNAAPGNQTVSFTYDGTAVKGTVSIIVTKTTKEYQAMLDDAVTLLLSGRYDEGVAKIAAAYESDKNDTTKTYYALAQLASISVDDSVKTLLTQNYGFKNYPAKLNSLFSTDWMSEYVIAQSVWCVTFEKNTAGSYVRVKATETTGNTNIRRVYKKTSDGYWIGVNVSLTGITADNDGDYLIDSWTYKALNPDKDYSSYAYWEKGGMRRYVASGAYQSAPGFNVPDWFANTAVYKQSLLNSAQSTQTVTYLLAANLITCNPEGYNTLVDNILNVFGTKFTTAKQLVSELSEESVVVPSQVLNAFNLTDMLGTSSIKIGKSEMDMFIGAMEIVQGAFQYVSSYNLSANVLSMESLYTNGTEKDMIAALNKIATADTFTIRNSGAVATAKETLLDAADRMINSYTYITQKSAQYPDGAKDTIKTYGGIWYSCLNTARSAIKDGGVFYIPSSYPTGTEWPTNSANTAFGIDMSKVFTPGNFTKIIDKKSDGSFQVYIGKNTKDGTMLTKLTDDTVSDKNESYSIGLLLNKSVLTSTLPGVYPENVSDAAFFIPLMGSNSSEAVSSDSSN